METAARQPGTTLRQLRDMLRQPWFVPCVAGLAACTVLFGEGTSISRWSITEAFSVSTSLDPVSGGWGILLAFALAAVLHGRVSRACRSQAWLAAAGALSGLAVLVLFAHSLTVGAADQAEPLVPRAAADVAGIVLGFSSTMLLLSWADALVPLGAQVGALLLGCAFVAVVLFDLALGALVEGATAALVATLAAFSPVMLDRMRPRIPAGGDIAALLGPTSEHYGGVVPIWSVFAVVALFGAVAGIIQSGVASPGATVTETGALGAFSHTGTVPDGTPLSWVTADAGTLLAGVVLILAHRLLAGNDLSFYRWGVLGLMAPTAFLSAVIPSNGTHVVHVLVTAARMLTFAFAWSLFSTPARSASPVRLFALGWLAFLLPNVVLTRLGRTVASDPAACLILDCALAAAIGVLFAVQYAADFAQRRYAGTQAGSFAEKRNRSIVERAQAIAVDCGLTAREAEVLALLMQGRSRAFIADALVISGETVRTHTQHIYAKLGVHSHDELVDRTLG